MNPNRKLRLLLVEDDEDHADLIVSMLRRHSRQGFELDLVNSAKEGLKRMGREDYDVLLLDLSLPDSGPELTLKRFSEAFPHAPIVVLTSLEDENVSWNAIQWGAQDFLDKTRLQGDTAVRAIRYAVERKRNLARLEQQNEELKRFAHTVAHEFKSPLQSVLTSLCLIQESAGSGISDSLNKLVTMGITSSERLSHLVTDILRFAESDSGQLTKELVDMESLAREVVASVQITENVHGCEVVIQPPLPMVQGASGHLRQVLQNLIVNAIKYRGTDPVRVEVGSKDGEYEQIIYVADNGMGISPDHQARIFEPFYRVHSQEEIPGTGIGLGFCKGAMERQGGRIWVESTLGEGSTFYIALPKEGGDD